MKKLVFVDAGVLIAAARGDDEVAERAIEVPNAGYRFRQYCYAMVYYHD